MAIDYIGYGYAALVAVGGIFGYAKAQSLPSLAAGIVFGGFLTYGAYQMSQNPNNYYLSLGASVVLTGIMGARFYNGRRILPAGAIAVVSLLNVLRLSSRVLMPVKEPIRAQ